MSLELSTDAPATATAVLQAPIDPRLDFFAGTVAGVASLLTGQPFDTIKVRLQSPPEGSKAYRNSVHALGVILKEEKVRGLYKGVMSPMLGIAAINASVFGCYKMAMTSMLGDDPALVPSLWQITCAGAASGIVTSLLTTPIERLKVLQQSSPPSLPQPSLVSLLRGRCSSLPSLYRGITPTILRDLAYGPYFATYEAICRWEGAGPERVTEGRAGEVEREVREVGTARVLLAGGAAGIVGWGSTFAMDVVKTRMQASERYLPLAPASPSTITAFTSASASATLSVPVAAERHLHPHASTWSTIRHSYAQEGAKVFVSGLGPTLLRSVPVNMVCFFVFEAVVSAFR